MKIFKTAVCAMAFCFTAATANAANIVQTAAAAGQFQTLLAAATAAGLAPALSGHTKLTVFAPTDAAFARLPKGTVESLLKPENKAQLVALLQYHVVPGVIRAKDIPGGVAQVATLKPTGDRFVVTKKFHGGVKVDRSNVVKADIHASNGVIHVIDKVLMPTF
jgi:uncharacterized surface protein with fasciclin (FAS1) repeats